MSGTSDTTVFDRPPPSTRLAVDVTPDTLVSVTSSADTSATPLTGGHSGNLAKALDHDEAGRMRVFSLVVIGIAGSAMVAILILGGHPVVQGVHLAGAALGGVGAAETYRRLRTGANYSTRMNTAFGLCAVTAVATGYFYWGIFSAVLLLLPFGAFIFASNKSLASALIILSFAYGTHLVASLLTIFGVVPDHGAIQSIELNRGEQLTVLAVVHGIFIAAFVVARGARNAKTIAIRELERAVRALSLREQLLSEAREELVRALQVGGAGRYTDQELGSYCLGELLGRGSMGEVYAGTHVVTGADAAVKVLHADVLADPHHLRRFLRELDLIRDVQSPHVVQVLETASLDQGIPFLAMERLRGHTLSEHLQLHGVLAPAEVVDLVRQVGSGLAAAHAAGIVHRDVKPQNVFLTEEGVWKVLDFGIGTLVDQDASLTRGRLVGTPAYMSPEQVRGEKVDYRSDLYALAAVAYRALTGHSVVSGRDIAAILHAVANGKPKRPSAWRATVGELDDVLAVGLAKSPIERFETAEELADALESATRGRLSAPFRLRATMLETFR